MCLGRSVLTRRVFTLVSTHNRRDRVRLSLLLHVSFSLFLLLLTVFFLAHCLILVRLADQYKYCSFVIFIVCINKMFFNKITTLLFWSNLPRSSLHLTCPLARVFKHRHLLRPTPFGHPLLLSRPIRLAALVAR